MLSEKDQHELKRCFDEARELFGAPVKVVTIWRRQPEGSWKILREIWNSDLPSLAK